MKEMANFIPAPLIALHLLSRKNLVAGVCSKRSLTPSQYVTQVVLALWDESADSNEFWADVRVVGASDPSLELYFAALIAKT